MAACSSVTGPPTGTLSVTARSSRACRARNSANGPSRPSRSSSSKSPNRPMASPGGFMAAPRSQPRPAFAAFLDVFLDEQADPTNQRADEYQQQSKHNPAGGGDLLRIDRRRVAAAAAAHRAETAAP